MCIKSTMQFRNIVIVIIYRWFLPISDAFSPSVILSLCLSPFLFLFSVFLSLFSLHCLRLFANNSFTVLTQEHGTHRNHFVSFTVYLTLVFSMLFNGSLVVLTVSMNSDKHGALNVWESHGRTETIEHGDTRAKHILHRKGGKNKFPWLEIHLFG